MTTPHDLDAERIGAALGGYVSCLDLVDVAVPLARGALDLVARRVLPDVVFEGAPASWRPRRPVRGCCRTGYADPGRVAEHLRSPAHVTARRPDLRRSVSAVVQAVQRVYADRPGVLFPTDAERDAAAACCVGGTADVEVLWRAGLHPGLVRSIHDAVAATGPLPVRFYLGAVTRRPDLDWVAATLAAAQGLPCPDGPAEPPPVVAPDRPWLAVDVEETREPLESWLAWTAGPGDVADPDARAGWLAAGVSRAALLVLLDAGYSPADITALAAALGRDVDGAARLVAGWCEAGARPDVGDLLVLERRGIPLFTPVSAGALARLLDEAGPLAASLDRTEAALLLAASGTVAHALAALRGGDVGWRDPDWTPPAAVGRNRTRR